jgi:hypothetical protein
LYSLFAQITKPDRLSAYERVRLRREAAAAVEAAFQRAQRKAAKGDADDSQDDEGDDEDEEEDDVGNEFYNPELVPSPANLPPALAVKARERVRVCRVDLTQQKTIAPIEDALTQGANMVDVPTDNAFNEVMANSVLRTLRMGANTGIDRLLRDYETSAADSDWEMAPMLARVPNSDAEGSVYIMPGDIDLLDYEDVLNGADKTNWLQRRYFLRWVARFWAKKLGCQFVIFDCAPANSDLNGMILANCDAILPPAFPDQYSTDSLRSFLNKVLFKYVVAKRAEKKQLDEFAEWAQREYATNSRWNELVHLPFPRVLPVLVTNFEACYNTFTHSLTMSDRSATWCNRMRDIMQSREVERFQVMYQTRSGNIRPTGEVFEKRMLMPHEVQTLLVPFKNGDDETSLQHVVALAPSAQIFVAQSHLDLVGMQFVNLANMTSAQDTATSRRERAIAKEYMLRTFRQLGERLVDFRARLLSGSVIQANVTLPLPPPPPAAAAGPRRRGGANGAATTQKRRRIK